MLERVEMGYYYCLQKQNFWLFFWGKRALRKFNILININCEYLEFCLKKVIKNE